MDWTPQAGQLPNMAQGFAPVQFSDRPFVKFSLKPVLLSFKSQQEGRPIYEDREFVFIQRPGERDSIEREATDGDRARFREVYEAFKSGSAAPVEGTPLDIIFPNEPSFVKVCQSLNVWTAEQMASVSDAALVNFGMGARDRRDKAQLFLEHAARNRGASRLEQENAELKEELRLMKIQIAALASADTQEPKRGPGRPRKVETPTED
jgi:hypothetical protein